LQELQASGDCEPGERSEKAGAPGSSERQYQQQTESIGVAEGGQDKSQGPEQPGRLTLETGERREKPGRSPVAIEDIVPAFGVELARSKRSCA
jgi:hypothetical protein